MTIRVAPVAAGAVVGATVLVDGRGHLVLALLSRLRGRPAAARVTADPPCRQCAAALGWEPAGKRWACAECGTAAAAEELAAWVRESGAAGLRAGAAARRGAGSRAHQVERGIPGAAAVLLRAVAAGGATSREDLLASVGGAERQALSWALREVGEGRLTAARCRQAVRALRSRGEKPGPEQLDLFELGAENVPDDARPQGADAP